MGALFVNRPLSFPLALLLAWPMLVAEPVVGAQPAREEARPAPSARRASARERAKERRAKRARRPRSGARRARPEPRRAAPEPARAAPEARLSVAPKEQARALVVQGVSELQAGDYLKALDLFQRAYALFPSPKILFNLGQVYRELGRIVDALDAYERFLREAAKDAESSLLDLARKQVVALKGKVATLLVPVEEPGGAIYVDGREVGITPMDVPYRVMPGTHAVEVRKVGFLSATANVTLAAGQRLVLPLVLRKPSKVVVKQVVYQLRPKPRKGLPVLWAGVAATAAFGAALVVTGSLTLYEFGVYKDTTKTVARRDLAVLRGRRTQWASEGLIGAAGAAAIFTTVWGLVVVKRSGGVERVPVPTEGSQDASPSVRLLPAGAGLLLEGTF